jgi:pimeloyl-ACP methyl ester carboxylesterase
MGGAEIGVADILTRLTTQSAACPTQKFALVGYSQGGGVVSSAAPTLPPALRSKVIAYVLYGAGDGSTPRPGGSIPPDVKAKTLANCAVNDRCGKQDPSVPQGAMTGHLSYASPGTLWHARTSRYIIDGFRGKEVAYKLEQSATWLIYAESRVSYIVIKIAS